MLIAALIVASLMIVFLATSNQVRRYEATAQIMPSDAVLQRPILWSVPASNSPDQPIGQINKDSQLSNLMTLVTSRTVAERTIRMLNLDVTPDVLRKQITVGAAPSPASNERGSSTDIIQISVQDPVPDRAVRVANAVALVFTNYYQEISHQNAVTNIGFLTEEVAKSESDLDRAENNLRHYKETKGVAALPEGTQAYLSSMTQVQQQRDDAAALAAEAQQKLSSVKHQLEHEPKTRTVSVGTTDSPLVQQLEAQVAALKVKLTEAQAKYYDVHPIVKDLQQQLADAQAKLDAETKKFRMRQNIVENPVYQNLLSQKSQLEADSKGLAAKLHQLDAALGRARGSLSPGEDVKLARLQQEFLDAQTRTSTAKLKLNSAKLGEKDTSDTGAIRLVDRALAATGPIGRSRSGFMFLGLILSLAVGVGLALTLEALDNRIRSNVDVEQLLSLPVNALIPSMTGRNAPALPKITYLDPLSPLAEAYRFLRTDLLLTAAESGCQVVMVATAKPGQGGTTTVANLAISLAMDGKRVILVDADMRRPSLHRVFKAGNEFGLSSVLTGERSLEESLVTTEIQNLCLLPAGPTPTNPSELLGSQQMGELVAQMRKGADFILLDTPSAVAFTDTVVVSRWVDGVLLVVRANQVPRGAELQVRKLFNKANVTILGVILNDVQPSTVDSYYYHSSYYPTTGPTWLALDVGKGEETKV